MGKRTLSNMQYYIRFPLSRWIVNWPLELRLGSSVKQVSDTLEQEEEEEEEEEEN